MPNWAEGSLKIRGTRQDIKAFLIGAIKPCPDVAESIQAMKEKRPPAPTMPDIKEDEFQFSMVAPDGFFVQGCGRAFIEGNIDWWFNDSHTEIALIDDFKQAWGVDAEPLAELSKQYNVDIRVQVFERGMQFSQDIEIHKGVIIRDEQIKYEDYEWDCPFPNLGG